MINHNAISSTRCKSVRFASNISVVTYIPKDPYQLDHDNDDGTDLWWNQHDYDAIIMTGVFEIAVKTRQKPVIVVGLVQAWFRAKHIAAHHGQHEQHQTAPLHDTLQCISADSVGLMLWCQYGHCRRGLEKYISRLYRDTTRCVIDKVCSRVIKLSRSGAHCDEIRRASERTSRVCTIFARMLGIADAAAAAAVNTS